MTDLFGTVEIRALSWKQPYASLMLHGKMETRTWDTAYRGLVLICASKKPYSESEIIGISGEEQTQRIFNLLNSKGQKEPLGMAIAIGELFCSSTMTPWDEDACFVKYDNALYTHEYRNVKPIEPFPWKGTQGWRRLTAAERTRIKLI